MAWPLGRTERRLLLRALGVSMNVTEVRYPVAALWELYKSAPLSKTMGKSCTGVQARCPVAWSPAAILRKPIISIHWPSALSATNKCAALCSVWREKFKSRNKTCFMFYIWNPRLLHRSHQRWWILSSSACYVDCTVFLEKVSNRFTFVGALPLKVRKALAVNAELVLHMFNNVVNVFSLLLFRIMFCFVSLVLTIVNWKGNRKV